MSEAFDIKAYEKINPIATVSGGDVTVRYHVPNSTTMWRVETLFTKEPETIAWIRGFNPDDVLVDVGANVGLYTIWAACTRGCQVYAFEPESRNFALLNRNIRLNEVQDRVVAWPSALMDEQRFALLHLSSDRDGSSGHSFGQGVNNRLQPVQLPFRQGSVCTTLDRLIADGLIRAPNHLKIDVDGFEGKVVKGAAETLTRGLIDSILVEINTNLKEHQTVVEDLVAQGFSYDDEQIERSMVREGPFAGYVNYVLRRGSPGKS